MITIPNLSLEYNKMESIRNDVSYQSEHSGGRTKLVNAGLLALIVAINGRLLDGNRISYFH